MTSTTVFKGSFGEKTSSRVLQPPGGGSSNIFAFSEKLSQPLEITARPLNDASICESLQHQPTDEPQNAHSLSSEIEVAEKSVTSTQHNLQSTIQPVVFRSRNPGFNPITGEFCGNTTDIAKKQSTCVTVRQPPGGASSGLW